QQRGHRSLIASLNGLHQTNTRSVRLQPDVLSVGLKADATYHKYRYERRQDQPLRAHQAFSSGPVLSPNVSIGTPTLSSIDNTRFVMGVWSGYFRCLPP